MKYLIFHQVITPNSTMVGEKFEHFELEIPKNVKVHIEFIQKECKDENKSSTVEKRRVFTLQNFR
jgi:sRNA-binding carbon storage regulator CsrA